MPFRRVVSGMDVVDALESGYGETSGGGIRAGKQTPLLEMGNVYLDENFPASTDPAGERSSSES